MIAYKLIGVLEQDVKFEAAYCKFFPVPYIALFQEYPSENTRVLLCRAADPDREQNYHLAQLQHIGFDGSDETMGHYVTVYEGRSEQEVVERLEKNLAAASVLQRIVSSEDRA